VLNLLQGLRRVEARDFTHLRIELAKGWVWLRRTGQIEGVVDKRGYFGKSL
jgi:hypothetical protein